MRLHAALDDEAHLQFARDLLHVDRNAAIAERCRARAHRQQRQRDSSVMMSSVMPSLKNSCSGSSLMLAKGRTQMLTRPCPRSAPGSGVAGSFGIGDGLAPPWSTRSASALQHLLHLRASGADVRRVDVDGLQRARVDRQRRAVEAYRHQDAAVGGLARLATHPPRLDRIRGPHHQHRIGGGQFGVDQAVELLAGRDRRVPPDRPAASLDRSHQRRHARPVPARVGDEDIGHVECTSSATATRCGKPYPCRRKTELGNPAWVESTTPALDCSGSGVTAVLQAWGFEAAPPARCAD